MERPMRNADENDNDNVTPDHEGVDDREVPEGEILLDNKENEKRDGPRNVNGQ